MAANRSRQAAGSPTGGGLSPASDGTDPRAAHRRRSRRWLPPIYESLAMVAGLIAINLIWYRDAEHAAFYELAPHPTLFIVLFVLCRYGFSAGLWSAAIATAGYFSVLLTLRQEPSFFHFLAAPYATPIVVLVPTTVILGIVVQRHIDQRKSADRKRAKIADENARLKEELAKLRDVNVDLAGKVVGADATLQQLYRYAKVLNVAEVGEIHRGLAMMLSEVLGAQSVSIWEPEGSEMRLLLRHGQGDDVPPFRLDSLAAAHFDPYGILSLHDVPEANRYPGLPYLVGKLSNGRGGSLAGYVTIDRLPFSRYNAETIRFFTLAADWASHSIGNANKLEQSGSGRATRADLQTAPPAGEPRTGAIPFDALLQDRDALMPTEPVVPADINQEPEPTERPDIVARARTKVPTLAVLLDEAERQLRGGDRT